MDKVFQEEKRNLTEVKGKLESIVSRYQTEAEQLQIEKDNFYCVDYSDRERFLEIRNDWQKACNRAKKYSDYLDSPYFARLDLDRENGDDLESFTYYIGEEGIADGSNIIVLDWRTPIAQCYYALNQRQFNIKEIMYTLALRRALDIKNGTLISYRTDYDGESVSLEGDVVDPFLLTVLKDKRRHNRLTNIIRTIQGNQNEIIRKAFAESFIVQGCAGSGKTMILLHRLSYLMFNKASLAGTIIITPNKFFDAHITPLSRELGLDMIERFSVDEYYVSLIKRYSSQLDVNADVHSEKILNAQLLTRIYSSEYMTDSVAHYHEHWEQILSRLDENKLRTFFDRVNLVYPDTSQHISEIASKLENGLYQMTFLISQSEKKKETVVSRLKSVESDLGTVQEQYANTTAAIDKEKTALVERIKSDATMLAEQIHTSERKIKDLEEKQEVLNLQRKQMEQEQAQTESLLHLLVENQQVYSNYDSFILCNDDVSAIILARFQGLISELADAIQLHSKTPLYNFGKRNSLRKLVAEKRERFGVDVREWLGDFEREQRNKHSELKRKIDASIQQQNTQKQEIKTEQQAKQDRLTRINALKKCWDLFQTQVSPDTAKQLSSSDHTECRHILSAYEGQCEISRRLSKRLDALKETKTELETELSELNEPVFNSEETRYIQECSSIVKCLQYPYISKNIMLKDLRAVYASHDQKYTKTNYRHKLYLKLLYCSLYFARLRYTERFLNIDEAQDISVVEYRLLKSILGEKCIFNLYGDINQSVYSYKGINDWEEIKSISQGNIYVLNENYRNTLQITEFCNHEFGAEVYPIGISGRSVQDTDLQTAVRWIIDLKKQNPEYRAAIIHRHGIKAIQEVLQTMLQMESISWHEVDDRMVSVISVETAKGLEFEAVVAIVDQMTNNEKYISYTRALEELTVVRDQFAADLDTDDADVEREEDNEDFISNEKIYSLRMHLCYLLESLLYQKGPYLLPLASNSSMHSLRINLCYVLESLLEQKKQNDSTPTKIFTDDSEYSKSFGVQEMITPSKNEKIHPIADTTEEKTSAEEQRLVSEIEDYLSERFGEKYELSVVQQKMALSMYRGNHMACVAPSGSMKSVLLFYFALKMHQSSGKQTIITADAHLQENELVLAERLGLSGGYIANSMRDFLADFKKEKYDVIFIPYDFFNNEVNVANFLEYFKGKVAYWGIDHPDMNEIAWNRLNEINKQLDAAFVLMSKEQLSDLNSEAIELHEIDQELKLGIVQKYSFAEEEDKENWLLQNLSELYGQGIVYCNDEATCRKLSKLMRKNRIMAEAYIGVTDTQKIERINYLTNSFSSGGLPILITTHEIGKNLNNPNVRFILHFDIPSNLQLYRLHVSQIGKIAENPVVYDLYIAN